MPLTYAHYLQLEQLLSLQRPQSSPVADDELLFIIMHQTYELWFKQVLCDLKRVQAFLLVGDTPRVLDGLKRLRSIFNTLLSQLDILHTMSLTGFLAFRGALGPSSGLQSSQFRAIEFVFGLKSISSLKRHAAESDEYAQLERRYAQPSLWDSFLYYLHRKGYPIPQPLLNRDVTQAPVSSPEVQEILLDIYRHDAGTAHVCEYLVDLDNALQNWRWQHMKLAERMIGSRYGSGGTGGVRYLQGSLSSAAFPDLWEVRNRF